MILAYVIAASLAFTPPGSGSAGDPLLVLDQHDYVYPRLSPDGTTLVVARALERSDGTETTNVILVDVLSGTTRELVGQRQAEANEAYETFVTGLRWLDARRVEVSLSDGDVGGTDLVVDVRNGEILSTDGTEYGDSLVPAEFADVAADAELYSPHFSREELERSLGNSAVRLDPSTVLVQRVAGRTSCRPVFHVEPRTRRIKRIATVPESMELWSAVKTGSRVVFLMVGDDSARLHSYAGKAARIVAAWSTETRNQCPRIEDVAGRSFVFIRPCTRSEPAQATLWEVTPGAAQRRELDEHLDEFSASADGARVALGVWRNGRRIVQVFDGSVLNAAERTPPK